MNKPKLKSLPNPFQCAIAIPTVIASLRVDDIMADIPNLTREEAEAVLKTYGAFIAAAMLTAGAQAAKAAALAQGARMQTELEADKLTERELLVPLAFSVRDAASANWVIRKIIDARTYGCRAKAWAEAEQRRAKREEDFLLRRFGAQLEEWARQQIVQQDDRRRSVSLPAGVIGFRTEQNRLSILDETKLLAWCRLSLPSAIRVVETVAKMPLMEHLKTTGECPSGAEVYGGNERFYVSAKKSDFVEGGSNAAAE